MLTNEKIEHLAAQSAANAFRPMASYDADSDCLDFFAPNDSFYAKSINRREDAGHAIQVA
jgi:hypothetical protein